MAETHNNQSQGAYQPAATPRVVPGSVQKPAGTPPNAYELSAATSLKALALKAAATASAKK